MTLCLEEFASWTPKQLVFGWVCQNAAPGLKSSIYDCLVIATANKVAPSDVCRFATLVEWEADTGGLCLFFMSSNVNHACSHWCIDAQLLYLDVETTLGCFYNAQFTPLTLMQRNCFVASALVVWIGFTMIQDCCQLINWPTQLQTVGECHQFSQFTLPDVTKLNGFLSSPVWIGHDVMETTRLFRFADIIDNLPVGTIVTHSVLLITWSLPQLQIIYIVL